MAFSVLADAKESNESCTGYAQIVYNTLSFREVELVSRNHAIGLHREANLQLKNWIEVGPRAYLGIDQNGRAVQIVELGDRTQAGDPSHRTVAFVLSGERRIEGLFLRHPNELVALDSDGELLGFQWSKWQQSALRQIITNSTKLAVTSACVGSFAVLLNSYFTGAPITSFENVMTLGVVSVASATLQAFSAAIKYGAQNDVTDGFEPLGLKLKNFRQSDWVWGEDGVTIDYELKANREIYSLNRLLSSLPPQPAQTQGFEYTCEHELLPRGIPSRLYDPQL